MEGAAMAKSFKPIGAHAIGVLARLAARNAIKQELRDQAIHPSSVDIAERAKAYLEANPQLYEEALQRAWRMGLIEQVERIEQAVFDDEKRKAGMVPEWRRAALFKTLKPTC
jgi:hypothetical protein